MIQRYLGNKNSIADSILQQIDRFCNPGDWVCDIFSGTISMSMAFKAKGYRVISNDICEFSYHFANCYLKNNSIPTIDLFSLGIDASLFVNEAECRITQKKGIAGFLFLDNLTLYNKYKNLAILLVYLECINQKDIAKKYRKHYFYDTYTEAGKNSGYKSLRGSKGNRRFFTPENGKRIDLIMNKIKEWYCEQKLSEILYSLLLSIVCESIEKISNTQGTYHDFQRTEYDERALNKLVLRLPPFDDVIGTNNVHLIGNRRDSLDFIKEIPPHKLIYIDPPYNFRQYTSYYFMLNLICAYCSIVDLDEYFSNIQFVRGQNMSSDFDSTFCKSKQFIPSLTNLIANAKTKYVVLSYYDGRNHVNKGEVREDMGVYQIKELFQSELFKPQSFELLAFERTNYQSFQGHSAKKCNELLFIGEKIQ